MLETHFRHHIERWLIDPVAKQLAKHLQPNQISLLSLGAGLLSALSIAFGWNIFAIIFLLLSGYLDMIDGRVARLTNNSSPFGAMLDIMCDRAVEWAIIFALYSLDPAVRDWTSLLMLGSVLLVVTSFLTAGIFMPKEDEEGKSFNYTPSLMERPEAFIFFIAMVFLPGWFTPLALLFSALVLYTAGLRLYESHIALSEQTSSEKTD